MTTTLAPNTIELNFTPRGGSLQAWLARDPEILVEGMAGTGKTRAILELINALCHRFDGLRVLIVRKAQVTLSTTALVTFNDKVLHPGDSVKFFGGSPKEPASYRYPNRSRIVVGGMDNSDKILSSEYDLIYANEATELSLSDWETLIARLRNGVLEHMRIIGDCNPSTASHWLNQRCVTGVTRRIKTRLEDNPVYYDELGHLTAEGQNYLSKLDRLTGPRYERLRLGLWTGVENAAYPQFDRAIHVRPLDAGLRFLDGALGADYGRVHKSAVVAVSVDQFGRRWVREYRGAPDLEQGQWTKRAHGQLRQQYGIRPTRTRVDPTQDVLAGQLGGKIAKSGEGSRQARIEIVNRLLNMWPGGRVPKTSDELRDRFPHGPFMEPDSPGLLFVEGAPGIDELCDQIEGYHFVERETATNKDMVIARIDEDGVAAMEYACEELDEVGVTDWSALPSSMPFERPKAKGLGFGGKAEPRQPVTLGFGR